MHVWVEVDVFFVCHIVKHSLLNRCSTFGGNLLTIFKLSGQVVYVDEQYISNLMALVCYTHAHRECCSTRLSITVEGSICLYQDCMLVYMAPCVCIPTGYVENYRMY